jgi:hypothetical protein
VGEGADRRSRRNYRVPRVPGDRPGAAWLQRQPFWPRRDDLRPLALRAGARQEAGRAQERRAVQGLVATRRSCGEAPPPMHKKSGEVRFALDSPLERAGFEPSVPRPIFNGFEASSELEPRRGGSAEQLRSDQPIGSEGGHSRSRRSRESRGATEGGMLAGAARGSAPPIPCAARRARGYARSGRESRLIDRTAKLISR